MFVIYLFVLDLFSLFFFFKTVLKKEFTEGLDIQAGLKLCAKVLSQALDANNPDAEKMEFSVLRRNSTDGASMTPLSTSETEAILEVLKAESASKADE
mgnify:CR=1 FL=1